MISLFKKSREYCALFILVLLVAACGKPNSPMKIATNISPVPIVGRSVTLHVEITTQGVRAPNTTAMITLSPGIELVEGNSIWQGDIEADQTVTFDVTIRVLAEGEWPISIYAYSSNDGGKSRWGDLRNIYIQSSNDSAEVMDASAHPTPTSPAVQIIASPTVIVIPTSKLIP